MRLEERPYPALEPGAMIARVLYCALCGTDVKPATIGHPRCHPPRIIGHEMSGRIEKIGEGVSGFEAGERITLATTVSCGACYLCSKGRGNPYPNARPISFDFDGALAEHVLMPRRRSPEATSSRYRTPLYRPGRGLERAPEPACPRALRRCGLTAGSSTTVRCGFSAPRTPVCSTQPGR
jgi:D-arabinose 1-dehydrogenase-like Zn-dependent alcohol dehydrogenase